MKQCSSILLALSSLLWASDVLAAIRPLYGGTLRIALKETPPAFDPASLVLSGCPGVSRLVFETLVALDDRGRPQPMLASSWQSESGGQRWRFELRSGVNFHDGAALDASTAAASLRASNPNWKVLASGDSLMIETESPDVQVPAELALPRNSIIHHVGGKTSGTGPFSLMQWTTAKHATLKTNDEYWASRTFLDAIEIDFGQSYRDQMVSLDLGKADATEVAPEGIHKAPTADRTIFSSQPAELIALEFANENPTEEQLHARNLLALSIDAIAINNTLFQGGGEATRALLPNWLSGYSFLFPSTVAADRVRQERAQVRRPPSWTLQYDASDPEARVIAERILLNARDVGITLQLSTSGSFDIRLLRVPLPSSEPHVALSELAKALQLPPPKFTNGSVTELYSAENTLLQTHRVIPLLHLRTGFALRTSVRGWGVLSDGSWAIANVWILTEKP